MSGSARYVVPHDEAIRRSRDFIDALTHGGQCAHSATTFAVMAVLHAQIEAIARGKPEDAALESTDIEDMLTHISAAMMAISKSIGNVADVAARDHAHRISLGAILGEVFATYVAEALFPKPEPSHAVN